MIGFTAPEDLIVKVNDRVRLSLAFCVVIQSAIHETLRGWLSG